VREARGQLSDMGGHRSRGIAPVRCSSHVSRVIRRAVDHLRAVAATQPTT
jgi:hypothetical protein